MRKLLLMSILVASLAGCHQGENADVDDALRWQYKEVVDSTHETGRKYRFATLQSLSNPVQDQEIGRYKILLSIYKEYRNQESDTYSAVFGIDGGDLKCPDGLCKITVQFDDEVKMAIIPKKTSARFFYIDGNSQLGKALIRSILKSEKMTIGIDLELVGYRVFEFNVSNLAL
ncbi:hypothetical protein AB8Q18_05935 [Neisseriaceae bacterium CLB008]|nr:hypothetical protein [Neisseriaceae bacterium]